MLTIAFIVFVVYITIALFLSIFGEILYDIYINLEIIFEEIIDNIKNFFNKR